jgi:hypothetical protein
MEAVFNSLDFVTQSLGSAGLTSFNTPHFRDLKDTL